MMMRHLPIATAGTRTAITWTNRTPTWDAILDKLRDPVLMADDKDQGGYVAGKLRDGRRRTGHVELRSMITLDADTPTGDLPAAIEAELGDHAYCLHETYSSTEAARRWRLVVPLSRDVTPDEYVPAALALMGRLGLYQWDPTTAQPERMMYWPARPDIDYRLVVSDSTTMLDPDDLLGDYADWTDATQWPDVGFTYRTGSVDPAPDPRDKPGVVGAFCRCYDIPTAITAFIPEAYTHERGDRWTWVGGHSTGGMVVYDDGAWAWSNHGTDPANGRLLNAFDIVRVHKFGKLDTRTPVDTPVHDRPSHRAMTDLALSYPAVRVELDRTRLAAAELDFDNDDDTPAPADAEADLDNDDDTPAPATPSDGAMTLDDLSAMLDRTRTGVVKPSARNIELVLGHDPRLVGMVGKDLFAHRLTVRTERLPWRRVGRESAYWSDDDDAGLRQWLEKVWGIVAVGKIADALVGIAEKNAFHPVRDYLSSLTWDGTPRVEMLLVDYLGADPTPYVKMVTRKVLVAAVARVFRPGTKFDHMIVVTSPSQGIGKSYLPMRLARGWFRDSVIDVRSKDAYEALGGTWIYEFSELAVTKKADVEAVKSFLSASEDVFRPPYGRRSEHRPRQTIFWGTTNEHDFLRDRSGNRRFWPVPVTGVLPNGPWDLTDDDVDQLWAEAMVMWDLGESLVLDRDETAQAVRVQEAHTDRSDVEGLVLEWLDACVPEDWDDWSTDQRAGHDGTGVRQRDVVCAAEVCAEALGDRLGGTHPARAALVRSVLDHAPGWVRAGREHVSGGYGRQVVWRRVSPTTPDAGTVADGI